MGGATSGKVTIDVEADVSKFAAQLAKDLNEAIKRVRLDMSPITRQMTEGFERGTREATQAIEHMTDRATRSFNQVSEAARRTGSTIAGSMNESVGSVTDRIVNIQNEAARAASTTAAAFQRAGRSMANIGDQMTYGLTLPIVGAGVAGVKTAADFEKAMNLVRAVSGVTGDEFQQLRKQAIDLGSSTQFSASEAAQAMYYLSSAGFDATQMYAAMPGVLNLAAAGAVDLATAADIAANVLNGFGMKADQLGRVNDVLAKAMAATAVDMRMLNDSFKYAGPIASSLGLRFEEVAAAVGLMGNAGIKGEMAGTALRGAMGRLIDPPKEAANALDRLGVSIKDSHGKMLPLVDIMGQLEKAGATTADMLQIFGLEAGPGMQALLSQGSGSLRKLTTDLQHAGGTADRMAKIQMEGFRGAWDNLTSAVEGLTIAIGDSGVLQDLTDLVIAITDWVSSLSKSNPEVLKAIFYFAAFAAAVGPILAIVGRLVTSIGTVIGLLKRFGTAFKAIGAVLGLTTGWFAVIVIAVVAVVGALVWAYFHFQKFRDICDTVFRAVGAAAMWLWNNAIRPYFEFMIGMWQRVGSYLLNMWRTSWLPALRGMGRAVLDAWNSQIRPALADLGVALKRLGVALVAWWNGGGREAFQNAAKVISWWWRNVTLPAIKGIIVVLGALAYALYWVFLNVTIPLIAAVIRAMTFFTNAWVWLANAARPVTQFLTSAFRTIAAIVTWWWNNITVPAFNGFVAALRVVISVVQFFWGVATAVFSAVASILRFFWGVASAVFNAIVAAIGVVVAVVAWFWGTFGPLWIAIAQLVWAVWSAVLSVVFALIRTALTLTGAAIMIWWSIFTTAWSAVASVVSAIWGTVIWPVLAAVGAAFAWLWNNAISPALAAIGSAFSSLWGVAQSVWNAIAAVVQGAVSRIVAIAGQVAGFVSAVTGHFTSAVNGVRARVNDMANVAASIPGRITSAVGNLGSLLFSAGQNVINGLISGIESRIGALRSRISDAAATIRNALPFSPAKEGPLSGRGDPTIAGGVIVEMITQGIRGDLPKLQMAAFDIGEVASSWWSRMEPPAGSSASPVLEQAGLSIPKLIVPPPSSATSREATTQVTYTINVKSIDPKAAGPVVVEAIKSFEKTNGKGWRRN